MNREHILTQALLRAWPFPRGTGRIIDRFFSDLKFKDEVATVRTSDGFDIQVIPNDLIGRHLYLTGEFDRTNVEVLCNLAEPGDTLLDIGANIGYISACFLKNVPNSTVIAIEPQPRLGALLRANLAQFAGRYQIVAAALSDRDGDGWIETNTENSGAGRLSTSGTPVKIWSVERLFSEVHISKVDLVKIDVEGHEETVLRALGPRFRQHRPRAILFEDHQRKAAPEASIGSLLSGLRYKVVGIRKRLTKLDYKPIRTASDCISNDYLALPHAWQHFQKPSRT